MTITLRLACPDEPTIAEVYQVTGAGYESKEGLLVALHRAIQQYAATEDGQDAFAPADGRVEWGEALSRLDEDSQAQFGIEVVRVDGLIDYDLDTADLVEDVP